MKEIGEVLRQSLKCWDYKKVVTIEASGIAPALYTADALTVPMIFAKKIQKYHDERRDSDG